MGWYSAFKAQLTGMGRCCFNCGCILLVVAVLSVIAGIIILLVHQYAIDNSNEDAQAVLIVGIVILTLSVIFLVASLFICCRICGLVKSREQRANQPMFMKRVATPPQGSYPTQQFDKNPNEVVDRPAEPSAPPPQ